MRFYITTPIYYVNGEPHLGHAYTTIAADVLARYHRQKGDEVFFLTGTDEHGNKVAQAAAERGLSPQQHADELSPRFRELARQVGATNDFFIRTTDAPHEAFVQRFVEKLRAAGDIEKRTYGGLYCTACEAFYYERDLVDGRCPIHHTEPVWLEEENYYFLLSRYQERLAAFFRANPAFVKPRSRYNEALSFIEQGLEDISISRSSITWGVPVPWDPEQVIYVWVDALINYLSALTYARPGEDLLADFWPAQLHVMAKDILKFHAVIWPALLMSAGYELPQGELIHGYLLMGGEKMSKTRGNVLDPFAVMDQFGIDPLRYYLMREVTFGLDGVISTEGFESRYNNELANELGNLVSRSVSMIGKYRTGTYRRPAPRPPPCRKWPRPARPWCVPRARTSTQSRSPPPWTASGRRAAPQPAGRRGGALEARQGRGAGGAPGRRAQRSGGGPAAGGPGAAPGGAGHGRRVLRRLGQPCADADLALTEARWSALVPAAVVVGPPLFPRIEARA